MSLRDVLRLDDQLDEINDAWADWTAPEPDLHPFTCIKDIQSWRREAPWQDHRAVLLAIGRLTQQDETAERATVALMELLMPVLNLAVGRRAASFRSSGRDVFEVAASYVWTAIREYPWHDPHQGWIAQALVRSVCRGIDGELGTGLRYTEAPVLEPEAWGRLAAPVTAQNTPMQASELYLWAITEVGVRVADMELLVELAVLASDHRTPANASAGLGSQILCREIAHRNGLTPRQVGYRAERALRQMRAHVGRGA